MFWGLLQKDLANCKLNTNILFVQLAAPHTGAVELEPKFQASASAPPSKSFWLRLQPIKIELGLWLHSPAFATVANLIDNLGGAVRKLSNKRSSIPLLKKYSIVISFNSGMLRKAQNLQEISISQIQRWPLFWKVKTK